MWTVKQFPRRVLVPEYSLMRIKRADLTTNGDQKMIVCCLSFSSILWPYSCISISSSWETGEFSCVLSDRNRLAPSIMQVRMFTKSAFSFVVCKHGVALPRFYVKKPQPNATMAIFPFLYSLRHTKKFRQSAAAYQKVAELTRAYIIYHIYKQARVQMKRSKHYVNLPLNKYYT